MGIDETSEAYQSAQEALALLKSSIHILLSLKPEDGLTNVQIGKSLGIYHGHQGHEGHIPRTLLGLMQAEGVVYQEEESKKWFLANHSAPE